MNKSLFPPKETVPPKETSWFTGKRPKSQHCNALYTPKIFPNYCITMPRKQKGRGFKQTHAERQLWLATTKAGKQYWAEKVAEERALKGGSFSSKAKAVAKATAITSGVVGSMIALNLLNNTFKTKLGDNLLNSISSNSRSKNLMGYV